MESAPKDPAWEAILNMLEEKLQMGLLRQARAVTSARLEGGELILQCPNSETREFFEAHVNQQRLLILSRGTVSFERIRVES
jgi:hypothetical protein